RGAGHGENDSGKNPQRFPIDHFAFPVAFFSSMGLGRPMPTVSAKASRASSTTDTFSTYVMTVPLLVPSIRSASRSMANWAERVGLAREKCSARAPAVMGFFRIFEATLDARLIALDAV